MYEKEIIKLIISQAKICNILIFMMCSFFKFNLTPRNSEYFNKPKKIIIVGTITKKLVNHTPIFRPTMVGMMMRIPYKKRLFPIMTFFMRFWLKNPFLYEINVGMNKKEDVKINGNSKRTVKPKE